MRITPPSAFAPQGGITPDTGITSEAGVAPPTMQAAYGENIAQYGSIVGDGSGQTIALIDAFNEPTIQTDLAAFDTNYSLPTTTLKVVNQTGGSSLPASDSPGGWGGETSLDVEWAHVMAPKATLLLVEATSDTGNNLNIAAKYAATVTGSVATALGIPPVSVVSMSWGSGDSSGESSQDTYFTTSNGVTFLASSGDTGGEVIYPSASSKVISVGGTTVTLNGSTSKSGELTGGYSSEQAWSSGGGGVSQYVTPEPTWQTGVVPTSVTTTHRATPDVAFDASGGSPVPVYDAYDDGSSHPWTEVYGTSLAAPMYAGLIAVANQVGEAFEPSPAQTTLNGASQTLPDIYSLPAIDFHDITTGSNGYSAVAGWDRATGRGSPYYNRVVSDLAADLAGVTLTLNASVSNGNLVIAGGAADDNITITVSGSNYLITSATSPITAGAGATQPLVGGDANLLSTQTVTVPISSVTGTISFTGGAGNDTLTVDYSNGAIAAPISLDGGTHNTASSNPGSTDQGIDQLILKGGTQGAVTINYTSSTGGSAVVANEDTVTFANTEKVSDTGTIATLALNLPTGGTNTVTLADDGTTGNGLSQISGSTIPTTIFSNPTSAMTVNRGSAADSVTVNALPDFTAGLSIGAAGSEFSTTTFAGAVTLASGHSLSANATGTISLTAATSDLATSGTGTISLTTAENVSLVSGSSIKAVNGNITISANQQATPTPGTFAGVSVTGGTIQTTGTGTVTIQGTGGNSGTGNYGIFNSGGTIASGAALSLLGAALDSATPAIHFDSAATASSGSTANLSITADSLEIADANSTITAGTATIAPRTAGTTINLGGADVLTGSPLTLGLSAAELSRVTAGTLIIGNANSGSITVSANISRAVPTAIQLSSGGDISISGGQIYTDGGTLQLSTGATGSVKPVEAGVDANASIISFVSGSNFTANLTGPTLDTQYTQLNASGTVNLTGAYLLLTGSYIPVGGTSFTIVSATQLTGTFNNMLNGSTITFNGIPLQLNYTPTAVTLTDLQSSVQSVVVNGGAAQRSRLTTITVNFASPVNASMLTAPGAITLTSTGNYAGGTVGEVVQTGATGANGIINVSPSSGVVSSVTLTFANADGSGSTAGVQYGSLSDGEWQLAIPSLDYTSTTNDPNLHRLFGDINGDGTVNAGIDQSAFVSAFGLTYDPNNPNNGYNAAFDFDNDGTIGAGVDQGAFVNRFGLTLP